MTAVVRCSCCCSAARKSSRSNVRERSARSEKLHGEDLQRFLEGCRNMHAVNLLRIASCRLCLMMHVTAREAKRLVPAAEKDRLTRLTRSGHDGWHFYRVMSRSPAGSSNRNPLLCLKHTHRRAPASQLYGES